RLLTPRRCDGAKPRRPCSGSNGGGTSGRGNGGGSSDYNRTSPSCLGDNDDINDDGGYGDTAGAYQYGSGGDGGGSDFGDDCGSGGGEGALHPNLGEELRELERLYGAADRTQSGYRSRQRWLDRRAAERERVYGPRHRDADVRLLALRRHLAAAGKLRRRGRFAPNDSMPRASTWHKLPPATQRLILEERAAALLEAVGLPMLAGRRLYLAVPGLLCDISYGVAALLRGLTARQGCSVETAAAMIVNRPLLGELRADHLEATAAELSVWVSGDSGGSGGGGLPLSLAMQRLTEEPSLAADGSMALIARCEALCEALALSRAGALQYMARQPRLMALDPRVIPTRVVAARRLMQLAAGRPAVRQSSHGPETSAAVAVGAAAGAIASGAAPYLPSPGHSPAPPPPPSLLLCSGPQLAACLTVLQRLLGLQPPVAASMLAAQPALALQSPAALAAAYDFLAANLGPVAFARASSMAVATGASNGATTDVFETLSSREQLQQSNGPSSKDSLSDGKHQPRLLHPTLPPQLLQQHQQQQQQQQQQHHHHNNHNHNQLPMPPLQVQRLVQECPDVLLLEPRRAATALDVLTRVLKDVATDGSLPEDACGREEVSLGWEEEAGLAAEGEEEWSQAESLAGLMAVDRASRWARRTAISMAMRAPRLLLCRLIPSVQAGGDGGGVADTPARSRQATIMSLVKAINEAQGKQRIDAAALALDSPHWPRPIVALPQVYEAGVVAPAAGDVSGGSVLDGPGGSAFVRSNESALTASAAAAGVGPVPIDLGLREAELRCILIPCRSAPPGGEVPAWQQPDSAASYGAPGSLESAVRVPDGSAWNGGVGGSGDAAFIRSWLWRQVLTVEPGLLLLPSTQLSATVEALCAWMAVPADALSYYLLPSGGVARPPSAVRRGGGLNSTERELELSPSGTLIRLRRNHVALLTLRADTLQRAGYHLWSWLSGGAASSAADVAAVLRAQPGLLYDNATMRTCGCVLHALLGDGAAEPGGVAGAFMANDANTEVESELPDWARVSPPGDADPWVGRGWAYGAVASRQAKDASSSSSSPPPPPPPSMPAAAASLLMQFAGEVLSEGVLQLLAVAPVAVITEAATATEACLAGAPEVTHDQAPLEGAGDAVHRGRREVGLTVADGFGPGVGIRLDRALGMLTKLLGIGRLAAAALVLSTRGSSALLVEGLSPAAVASVERAMLAIRRGGAWRREMRRYLNGSTSYGGAGFSEQGLLGGESLEAVSASAQELLVVLREWRRVARLEALEAAGLQDAVSFAMVLQLPEDEWRKLALRLQLSPLASLENSRGLLP
ncbi:hypothetical protein VaNZ11_011440, partial [Volvox africanus]